MGDRFEGDILAAVHAAADSPDAWAVWPGWDREPLTLIAVAHAQRRPGYWRDRVAL